MTETTNQMAFAAMLQVLADEIAHPDALGPNNEQSTKLLGMAAELIVEAGSPAARAF